MNYQQRLDAMVAALLSGPVLATIVQTRDYSSIVKLAEQFLEEIDARIKFRSDWDEATEQNVRYSLLKAEEKEMAKRMAQEIENSRQRAEEAVHRAKLKAQERSKTAKAQVEKILAKLKRRVELRQPLPILHHRTPSGTTEISRFQKLDLNNRTLEYWDNYLFEKEEFSMLLRGGEVTNKAGFTFWLEGL